jgi:tetratricopeptide (TPR) repeat protein
MNIYSCCLLLALALVVVPVMAADDTGQSDNAWYWYNKAVDLANAGRFSDALAANEKALSINRSMPVAWANEAGILVQLGRYTDAIAAAENAISGNSTELPNTYAAAYYSKGDALRALGRTAEAKEAYAKAYALDKTLVPPVLTEVSRTTAGTPLSTTAPAAAGTESTLTVVTSTPRSSPAPVPVLAALAAVFCLCAARKNR